MRIVKWLYKRVMVNFIATGTTDNLLEPVEVEANLLRSF